MILLLFALAVAHAQSEDAPSEPAEPECFPPCSPGYLCHEGACIEACNPACGEGFRCTAERICDPIPSSAPTEAAQAASESKGTGVLCVFRKANPSGAALKWTVQDEDGVRLGLLGDGRYLCKTVAAGTRTVTLEFTGAGIRNPPSTTLRVDVPKEGAAHVLGITKMGFATSNIHAEILTAADADPWFDKLKPAQDSEPRPQPAPE